MYVFRKSAEYGTVVDGQAFGAVNTQGAGPMAPPGLGERSLGWARSSITARLRDAEGGIGDSAGSRGAGGAARNWGCGGAAKYCGGGAAAKQAEGCIPPPPRM